MEASEEGASELFSFSGPKLLSQKSQTQVVYCKALDLKHGKEIYCVLKFFLPRATREYVRELAVYSAAASSEELQDIVPLKLWSGTWSQVRYYDFLGENLPSLALKSYQKISVVALQYIDHIGTISNAPKDLRPFLVKLAIHSLRCLHNAHIIHGEITQTNLLTQRENNYGYLPYWVDFSSSTIGASSSDISHEWEKAIEYFSDLVYQFILTTLIVLD